MSALRRLWRGEIPLAEAFWSWAVLGALAVNITTTVLCLMLISADQSLAGLAAGYLFSVPYNIAVLVGVWRSAARYAGPRHWADLARLVTLVGMVALSLT